MRYFFRAFSRYRPRLLTVALLALIAALITLSNLSAERSLPQGDWRAFGHKSYGWPLIWHRYVLCDRSRYTEGWYISYPRLAANLALWLTMLVVPAAWCEWLVRRYRPRFQWSLRTMLAAAPPIALACAWFVHARDRANEEDALIAMIHGRAEFLRGEVWMERWGPKWLDLVGADRLRSLHLGGSGVYQLDSDIKWSTLPLDNGSALAVLPTELEARRRSLETLRQCRAGIVIDDHVDRSRSRFAPNMEDLGPDAQPECQWTWWPASEWPSLSPADRVSFQQRGAWARFDAAGWEPNGPTTTF